MNTDLQSTTDEDLARQSQLGSVTAFEELVFRFERRIYAFVNQSCRNFADAREITQDTFVKAHQAIVQYDADRPFASWLFSIARRKSIDHHRAHASRRISEGAPPDTIDENDPATVLARFEERQGIWTQARRHLSEAQYQALWLKYVEEMTVSDIARVLRKTEVHIKVLLFRARRILACRFQRDGEPIMPHVDPAPVRDAEPDRNLPASDASIPKPQLSLPCRKGIL